MLASVNLDNGNLNSSCRHHPPRHLRLATQAEIKRLDFQSLTLIERALLYDQTHTLNDVLTDLRAGRAQLWLATDNDEVEGIAVTCITEYPQTTTCLIWLCAGISREKYTPLIGNIEQWAKSQGCDSISLEGRAGWERILTDFNKTKIILEKRL
tara:strand:- start:4099 stop:4560 length:462 start_codon:yes stop_codon:yes gene_type:complete